MSDENIHIKSNDDDKIIVKDNTQIIKLQGPKGEPVSYTHLTLPTILRV